MNKRIAVFKNMEYGYEHICDEHFDAVKGYVRLTDYIEVEFTPVSDEKIVQQQIDQLDAMADQKTAEYRRFMAGIDERKSRLLAITHQPEPQV